MVLNRNTTRTFHRTLFATELETVTLLKRGDDQQEGTVTAHRLFEVRIGRQTKTGEPIAGEMASDHRTIWHIPRISLDAVGVQYINAGDRIVDQRNMYWEPESPQIIDVKLFENHIDLQCVRIDPPDNVVIPTPNNG